MQRVLALGALLLLLYSCSSKKATLDGDKDCHFTMSGDTVVIPQGSPLISKIKLLTIAEQEYCSKFTTTGTVKIMTGCSAEVSTPFEGRIARSFVRLGQKISAGTPIFEVYSSDYFETVKQFVQAKQEKQLAASNFNRQKDLVGHGVGSKKDMEEAETALHIAQKECEKAEASLKIFNVKPSEAVMGKPLVVCSPISGEIVKDDITVGQYLKGDANPVVTVANLNKVWVIARVKEKNIGLIGQKDQVEVVSDAYPNAPVHGVVSYIGNILDEQTRSVEFYIECNNSNRMLKPGMFASVSFEHKSANTLVVPSSTILQGENSSFLFIKVGNNRFVKKQVNTSTTNDKEVVVRSGLTPGDVVVTKGGVYLR